ncbi:MAG: hypothetical protein CVV44_21010 [Spirochaetae bacterium HGW-Spirochaetae-1]|nr:MAG: hypothetical protein CVV44_21010 [Spirochaetae bacterium HGW-Spirochaetae-1]
MSDEIKNTEAEDGCCSSGNTGCCSSGNTGCCSSGNTGCSFNGKTGCCSTRVPPQRRRPPWTAPRRKKATV